jgi:hypothetical protein
MHLVPPHVEVWLLVLHRCPRSGIFRERHHNNVINFNCKRVFNTKQILASKLIDQSMGAWNDEMLAENILPMDIEVIKSISL